MTDLQRSIVLEGFKVTVDADGYEHYEWSGASTRAISRANDILCKFERLLSRIIDEGPDAGAFRVWHLLTIKKATLLEVAAKGSHVEQYLTRPRPKGANARKRPTLTKVQREQREANSRKTIAIRTRRAVEQFKALAPAWLFDKRYSAAVDHWPHK
jgi:hypothetical protein